MSYEPDKIYRLYQQDRHQDMYEYSPLFREKAKGNIMEIGVRGGVSSAAFLLGLEVNGGHLYSVDINNECRHLYEGHSLWTFIHGNSAKQYDEIVSKLPGQLDILFIDGDHTHPGVDADFRYADLVRPGGMLFVHDIIPPAVVTPQMIREGWGTKDVPEAYFAYIKKHGYAHQELPGQFGMGVITK